MTISCGSHDASRETRRLTKSTAAEDTARLGGRRRRRRILIERGLANVARVAYGSGSHLDLGRCGRPRLAHGVCTMHLE